MGGFFNYLDTNKLLEQFALTLQLEFFDSERISQKSMVIDASTLENLEILETSHSNLNSVNVCLFENLDFCQTGSGRRNLRQWVSNPLIDPVQISERLDALENLHQEQKWKKSLRNSLKRLGDFER